MHKVNPNIFLDFLGFYSPITFLSHFTHCDIFSQIFLYSCCCSLHLKSLSFQHGTLICFHLGIQIPAHHVESYCIIRIACAHLGMLSGVEAGAGYDLIGQNWVYEG